MNYNDIISLIVNDFNRNFNLSSEIIYDSRENIINKNPHFKIGKEQVVFLIMLLKEFIYFLI